MTQREWESLYLDENGNLIPSPNDGALPGRRVNFTAFAVFAEGFGSRADVLGDMLSMFLTVGGGDFDQRAQLPDEMSADWPQLIAVEFTGVLPPGWSIEVGQNAPVFGRGGGAYYAVVLDASGQKCNLFELEDHGVIRVVD